MVGVTRRYENQERKLHQVISPADGSKYVIKDKKHWKTAKIARKTSTQNIFHVPANEISST